MKWTLRERTKSYHCPPYSLEPGVQGWSAWVEGDKTLTRVGGPIESFKAAKALCKHHAELNAVKS
jgi:hypothetical protein